MKGKRILLGITGGIAAYKIATLIRILKKEGAEVRCIMTPASCDFISPLVVSTLSGHEVGIEFWDKRSGKWTNHVEYGLWAELFVIAPLTATTMSKMAKGSCDNLLLATYLSMKCPTMVAPAMDLDMYAHPATKRNLKQLEDDKVLIIPAESGELASGLEGEGRMAEPETILRQISAYFAQFGRLKGRKVLMTVGPTYESIDPVRFIGNHSTGKMGFAIAEKLLSEGAEVIMVCGPTALQLEHPSLRIIKVRSAEEMFGAVQENWVQSHIGVFSAAVADYRPEQQVEHKIKKSENELTLNLVKNPDILSWAGANKGDRYLVGFALETNNAVEHAIEKRSRKNLDMIVLNSMQHEGAGFAHDTNRISIIGKDNKLINFELKPKSAVAADIVEYLITANK